MRVSGAACLAAGLLLIASQAHAAASPPGAGPMPEFGCKPAEATRWLAIPSGDDIARLYPREAVAGGVEGHSTMSCLISADGRLQDCEITEETPPGRGFGPAMLQLAPLFSMTPPQCADGSIVLGGKVTIPMQWRIG